MTRKRFENTHDEALSRLCFVCGDLINVDVYFYEVEKCSELLSAAFKRPGTFSIPAVTPYHICRKCHRTLEDVASGVIIKTGKELLEWAECSTDCETCAKLLKRKIVRGRPKKKKSGGKGRPKIGVWSNSSIPESKEVCYDANYDNLTLYNSESILKQCLCVYCGDVIVGPLQLMECEHGSCRTCFVKHNFKEQIAESKCRRCEKPIESVIASGMLQTCIDNLNVKCNNGSCDEMVSLSSLENHKSTCSGQGKSMKSLILKEVKEMLSQSQNGFTEIATGGQAKDHDMAKYLLCYKNSWELKDSLPCVSIQEERYYQKLNQVKEEELDEVSATGQVEQSPVPAKLEPCFDSTMDGLGCSENTQDSVVPDKCSNCNMHHLTELNLGRHSIAKYCKHCTNTVFQCATCMEVLPSKKNLDDHVLKHEGQGAYPCFKCEKSFAQKRQLERHLSGKHQLWKPSFLCSICEKSYATKHNMQRHLLTHTKETQFSCSSCVKSFSTKQSFDRHMLNHFQENAVSV